MRLLLCYAALVLVALTSCGQATPTSSASPAAPGKPVAVPGTHLLLVPPPGFHLASTFTGLENAAGSKLSIMDISPNNYFRHANEFTRQLFEDRGATVLEFEQTTIGGYPARYIYLQTPEGSRVSEFAFGDSTFAALAIGELAAGREQDVHPLKQAMLAGKYDKHLKTDALASAPFQLDVRNSPFRFFQATGGMYIYSIGGKNGGDTPATRDQPVVMVTPLPAEGEGSSIEGLKQMMAESLERNGSTNVEMRESSSARVNGYEAYEAVVHCLMKGRQAVIYQLFALSGGKAIIVQGIIPASNAAAVPASLREVKTFAHTLTLH